MGFFFLRGHYASTLIFFLRGKILILPHLWEGRGDIKWNGPCCKTFQGFHHAAFHKYNIMSASLEDPRFYLKYLWWSLPPPLHPHLSPPKKKINLYISLICQTSHLGWEDKLNCMVTFTKQLDKPNIFILKTLPSF